MCISVMCACVEWVENVQARNERITAQCATGQVHVHVHGYHQDMFKLTLILFIATQFIQVHVVSDRL